MSNTIPVNFLCSLGVKMTRVAVALFYPLTSGLALWSLQTGVGTQASWGQAPEGVWTAPTTPTDKPVSPDVQAPEGIWVAPPAEEPVTPAAPDPTFRPSDIPPQSYSPPVFDINTSEQFNLYRLAIGDSINVIVNDFPEFSFSAAIDFEGQVRIPFLGTIAIVGLTLDELETKVAYELGQRFLQEEPEVIATLVGARPVQLTIIGEVVRPGYYFFGAGITLNNVITAVGGSTPQADLRSIIIRRRLVDGTTLEEKVDLYTPLIQGTRLPEFRLQGGDTVILAKLETGQQNYDQNLIARTNLSQPSIIVRVLVPTQPAGVSIRNVTLRNGSTFLDAVANFPTTVPGLVKNEVTLLRFDPEQGKVVAQGLNPIATVQNLDVTQYVTLRDQDVIVVNRTLLGQVFSAFRVLTQPIRDLFGFSSFITGIGNSSLFGGNNNNNNNRNSGF